MKIFFIILAWFITILSAIIYSNENKDQIDLIKYNFNQKLSPKVAVVDSPPNHVIGNSFMIDVSEIISFSKKTAFIIHEKNNSTFNKKSLKIYFQNGFKTENLKTTKLNLPSSFTTAKNGGIKTVFHYKEKAFALISSLKNDCYYASIVSLDSGKELFKTKCLPKENLDYNGLGSSNIHHNNKIFISIGTPEQISSKIAELAQDKNSAYGKILEINKKDLKKVIESNSDKLDLKIFTMGHRNPQGFTRIEDSFFSVEHGPRGGDELNKIEKDKNYGWPKASYGTKYGHDENSRPYYANHEKNNFEEPLFALVPSVGISALNICPTKLQKHYEKPCLMALSLYGNDLRPGKSVIIYLLNEEMNKVHSIEKIYMGDNLKLRHFVTNSKNELYEDVAGDVYVSVDKKGIYKFSFIKFSK